MEGKVLSGRLFASYLALLLMSSATMILPLTSGFGDKDSTSSTIVIYPSDDATIEANHPNSSTGSSKFLCVRNDYGEGGSSGWGWYTLIKFDISSIPSETVIASAKLKLYYHHWRDNNPKGHKLKLYRIMEDWDEDTVTWNNSPERSLDSSSSSIVPYSTDTWIVWDVTEDVQKFINGNLPNYGWEIVDITYWGMPDIPTIYFCSKEYDDSDYIPYLEIKIDTTPPTVEIKKPDNGVYLFGSKILPFFVPVVIGNINIEVNAFDSDTGIKCVEIYIDDTLKANITSEPFVWRWTERTFGRHTLKVVAFDNAGNKATDEIIVWKIL